MPPRQKTTFKKGQKKGTTTYKDYSPEKERASSQLARFIRDNPAGDRRNLEQSPEVDVVTSMPVKFQKSFTNKNGILDIPNYSDMNSQQKYLFGIYDNVNKYQRDMNNLRTSSPEMAKAYAERFPKTNFAMNILPSALPFVGPLFTADKAIKANRRKQEILNTPVNKPDGGFKNFVDFFAKGMTPDQAKNTEIISGETLRLAPQDIFNKSEPMTEEQKANVAADLPFRSPQDMGFLDDENIFDSEKAAIDAALTPGNVYNPIEDSLKNKVDFLNARGGSYSYDFQDPTYRELVDRAFEKEKRLQGLEIRPFVDAENAQEEDTEDPIPGGQFDLTNPAFSDQTNLVLSGDPEYDFSNFNTNTELGSLSENPNLFPEGGVSGTPVTQAGQELVFSDGTPVTQPVNTGLDMVGDKAFPNSPGSQEAMDILNSNADPYFSGYPTMRFNEGGSTNKYENMSTHEKLMRMAAEMYG